MTRNSTSCHMEMQMKPQGDATTHQTEWLKSNRQVTPNPGKEMVQLEHSHTASASVNWYNHFEKLMACTL